MRRLAVALLGVVAVAGTQAHAGVVTFSPDASVFSIAPGAPNPVPDSLGISVKVDPNFTEFDSGDILIGSDTLPITAFEYDPAWASFATSVAPPTFGWGFYPYDVYLAGSRPTLLALSEVNLGVVTVDLRGLDEGTYAIGVSSDTDGGVTAIGRNGVPETLFGRATITIVPEPATLALLGVGALAAMWRRRRTA